jgi:phage shock protein PspC (stress-responsive transcriptional regulator)
MSEQNWLKKLSKSQNDKWIGGVCGGFGMHSPMPSWIWRVIFCTAFLFYGTGLIIYILLWIFMPGEKQKEQAP